MAGYGDYHTGGQSDNWSGGYGQGSSADSFGGSGHSSSQDRGSRGRGGGGGNRWGGNDGGQKRNFSDHNSANRGGSYSGSGGGGGSSYNRRGNDNNEEEDDGGNRMETQRDTIFIQNLPRNVSREDLQKTFSQIGVIKTDKKTGGPKIWIYKDKVTGDGKGEATITYDDEEAALAAINWYNDKEVLANIVKITLATRRVGAGQAVRGRGRGGYRGGGGGGDRGSYGGDREDRGGDSYESRGRGGGGYRGRGGGDRGGDRGGFRGGRGGASRGFSRDNRTNPY